jgi:hypothetical protein
VNAQVEPPRAAAVKLDKLNRAEFNRLAVELDLPLFWIEDRNADGVLSPDELAVLWGVMPTARTDWVDAHGQFTTKLVNAYEQAVKIKTEGFPKSGLSADEVTRRETVRKELAQGRPTLVLTRLGDVPDDEKEMVNHLLAAANVVERIYARQRGSFGMADRIARDDTSSQALFFRNAGPWCEAPRTENDPSCNAIADRPKKISGLYPAALQADPGFCKKLEARKDADQLLHQFVVVAGEGDNLRAVPYHEAYKAEMTEVSEHLKKAAGALKGDKEGPLRTYLVAAAQSFLDNNWLPSDEAWAKMSVSNSKWYVRVAPDEVYFEPCSRKAGFHVTLARINQDSLKWQNKLDPVKTEMEQALAKLAGKPYTARNVSFHLPDFIDITVNAGEDRKAHGATIGQSLPNWGQVANEGRGRTVAMTNLYTDADSKAQDEMLARSMLCEPAMKHYTRSSEPLTMSTVLHEASHNLGPAHEYKVKGKKDGAIFGGPLASTLEELKAQTGALYFTGWLAQRKLIDDEAARQAHVRDLTWAFGHISRGMYAAGKKPRPYSQLAAIQLGFLRKNGVVKWHPKNKAANGQDVGCFSINHEKFHPTVTKMMVVVGGVKARGDKALALRLIKEHVDGGGETAKMLALIKERWLRAPKASFVYSIER